jgi:hypothetical protein
MEVSQLIKNYINRLKSETKDAYNEIAPHVSRFMSPYVDSAKELGANVQEGYKSLAQSQTPVNDYMDASRGYMANTMQNLSNNLTEYNQAMAGGDIETVMNNPLTPGIMGGPMGGINKMVKKAVPIINQTPHLLSRGWRK